MKREWTLSAIECYQRKCNCSGCMYQRLETLEECHMKRTVTELIYYLGRPKIYICNNEKIINIRKRRKQQKVKVLSLFEG